MNELEVLAEELKTGVHPRAVITRPLPGWVMPCPWSACGREPTSLVNAVQLCEEHAAKRLGQLLWDARIGGVVDHFRAGGFEPFEDDELREQAS